MPDLELTYFKSLKKEIAEQLRIAHPELPSNIQEWKGSAIVIFQEDLLQKVGGQISEKWFYTHLKKDQEKPPRIDILNMLSEYAGHTSWSDYKHKNPIVSNEEGSQKAALNPLKVFGLFGIALVVLSLLIYFVLPSQKAYTFEFHFYDQSHRKAINTGPISITVYEEGQSPRDFFVDSNGVFIYESSNATIELEVKAPYYQSKRITREITTRGSTEEVFLQSNDYEMMLHYYATSDLINWKKRRNDLEAILDDKAVIYQMYFGDVIGAQKFSKREFINIMSTPTKSLQSLKILETEYDEGLITKLKFSLER